MILKNDIRHTMYKVRCRKKSSDTADLRPSCTVQRTSHTVHRTAFFLSIVIISCFSAFFHSSCNIYKFNQASIPDTIKTVKVIYFENHARYVNPQLSQKLTDKFRQKIIGQTKLSQTNSDNADWEITGFITDYAFSTSAISGQQVTNNRLTVSVHITFNKRKDDKIEDYDVSSSFEFKGNQSFQQIENSAQYDEMVKNLTDEIFNKLFSNW